ncbi:hypothetical protein EK904_000853 [Melospiza melodia maxima]|nr:hypothetical protein EK904_000853 [Melospiza melodia maxima]
MMYFFVDLILVSFLILTTLPVQTGLDALTASIVVPAAPFFIQQELCAFWTGQALLSALHPLLKSRAPLSPGVNSPRQRGAGAIVLRLCGARARPRQGHLRSAGPAPPALRARARRDLGRLPLLPRCPLRAAAAGGSPEQSGPGRAGLGWGCRGSLWFGTPRTVRCLKDCGMGHGKAARASLLPGAAAAAACCSHSRRPRRGAASEGEALNGEPKAALAYLYSCSKSRRLPIRLRLWSSVMNPSCLPLLFRCLLSEELHPGIDAVELLAEQWENWLIQWKALNAVAKAALSHQQHSDCWLRQRTCSVKSLHFCCCLLTIQTPAGALLQHRELLSFILRPRTHLCVSLQANPDPPSSRNKDNCLHVGGLCVEREGWLCVVCATLHFSVPWEPVPVPVDTTQLLLVVFPEVTKPAGLSYAALKAFILQKELMGCYFGAS